MNEIPLKQVIDASLENLKKVINVDTVIGSPITLPGDIIVIPMSKVSAGFTSGGVDFDSKLNPKRETPHFGGGNGAGVTISPVSFLVISAGEVKLLNVNGNSTPSDNSIVGTISELIDKTPSLIIKLKKAFKKDGSEETE